MTATATRERPILFSSPMVRAILDGRKSMTRRVVKGFKWDGWSIPPARLHDGYLNRWGCARDEESIRCPFAVGMRLWVRETWQEIPDDGGTIVYRATDPDWATQEDWTWRPSIFMPRAYSRITLEITDVRVERLTKISSEDAQAEGFDGYGEFLEAFYAINAKRITYADDPWVWAITFSGVQLTAAK